MTRHLPARVIVALGVSVIALVATACTPAAATPPPSDPGSANPSDATASAGPSAAAMYRIGVSNPATNDGWREAMVCSVKAQALASGRVGKLTVADRMTDAKGQSADIRDLVATGVDALIVAPANPAGVKDAIADAIAAGVDVVTVGKPVDAAGARVVATDQEAYGFAGASWLFEQLKGKGSVIVFHGRSDDPIDAARDAGVKRALEAYPDIKVAAASVTERIRRSPSSS